MTAPLQRPATLTDREPVVLGVGTIAALVDAVIILGTVLDWINLSDEQAAAIVVFVTSLSGVVGALVRSVVWSRESVAQLPGAPEVP